MAEGERIAVSNTVLVGRISRQATHKCLSSIFNVTNIALLLTE